MIIWLFQSPSWLQLSNNLTFYIFQLRAVLFFPRWSLSITFLSYLSSLCLMTKLFASKGLGGCIEQAWATLFSHPCILYTLWILQPSVQIGDCVLALRLNVRGVRKLSYLASVNGELFIHYKRLLLASSKSKAVFGDIVLFLSLFFYQTFSIRNSSFKIMNIQGKSVKINQKITRTASQSFLSQPYMLVK